MTEGTRRAKTVDEYIENLTGPVQKQMQSIRKIIRKLAPDAVERISYQMPAFYLNGNLVYYAAFKNHIGFFPTASGVSAFQKELRKYKHARGSIQFPLDEKLPIELISKIVTYRVEENRKKGNAKKKRPK